MYCVLCRRWLTEHVYRPALSVSANDREESVVNQHNLDYTSLPLNSYTHNRDDTP